MCQDAAIDWRQDMISRKNNKSEIMTEKYKERTYIGRK